jgi:hypothetical protein
MSNLNEAQVRCPYCGEPVDIQVDAASTHEDYVEDCTVCCRPMVLHVARDEDGSPSVSATSESE